MAAAACPASFFPRKDVGGRVVERRDDGDRVDRHVEGARARDHLVGGPLAGGVQPVGQDHDRPAPLPVARDVAGGLVEGVVEGGRAERGDRLEPLAHGLAVVGEGHDAPVAAVEAGHRHLVLRAEGVEDLPGRPPRVGDLPLLAHAPARVHEQEDPRRQAPPAVEVHDRLGPPLLEDAELLAPQVGDRPALAVHRRGREHHQVAPRREGEHLPGGGGREGGQRHDTSDLLQQVDSLDSNTASIAASAGAGVIRLTPRPVPRSSAV